MYTSSSVFKITVYVKNIMDNVFFISLSKCDYSIAKFKRTLFWVFDISKHGIIRVTYVRFLVMWMNSIPTACAHVRMMSETINHYDIKVSNEYLEYYKTYCGEREGTSRFPQWKPAGPFSADVCRSWIYLRQRRLPFIVCVCGGEIFGVNRARVAP